MGADFHINSEKLKVKGTFVQKLRIKTQIISKSVGAKSFFIKICKCTRTHTNVDPGPNGKVPFDIALFSLCCGLKLLLNCFFLMWHSWNFQTFSFKGRKRIRYRGYVEGGKGAKVLLELLGLKWKLFRNEKFNLLFAECIIIFLIVLRFAPPKWKA